VGLRRSEKLGGLGSVNKAPPKKTRDMRYQS
jgi:hypothetical protein